MAEQYDAILIWGLPGAETADLLAFGHAAGIPTLYQTGDADELHENIKKFSAKTGPRMLVLEIARRAERAVAKDIDETANSRCKSAFFAPRTLTWIGFDVYLEGISNGEQSAER